ncbi:MAG: hypothetical protein WAT19_07565 [Ferruginibacter sp.]
MKNVFLAIFFILAVSACSPMHKFNKDKAAFEAAAVSKSFKAVSDMNDSYFDIRENNFFEFYRQLFDSVKNTRYPGKYSLQGDTMILQFYDKKGYELLGKKAYIDKEKKEIIFFDQFPGIRKKLIFN